jgi:nucleoside-diphosphate-sugar epimerase
VGTPRVLITGATGFVGTHVVREMAARGVRLRALVRRSSDTRTLEEADAELVSGSLTEPESLARAATDVDVVVHLAGLTSARSNAEYRRVNEIGTRDLVRAAADAASQPRRFVYLSSLAAVGPSIDGEPVGPGNEPRPVSAYGRSKLAGEMACQEAAGDIEVCVLRAPAVYGPGDREMFRFFRMAKLGVLPVPAGQTRKLQFVHVGDLAGAIVRAALKPEVGGLFHIAEPTAYADREFARLIGEAVGARVRIMPVPGTLLKMAAVLNEAVHRAFGRSSVFNRDKTAELLASGWECETGTARQALGFEAEIPLPRGLRETADWYARNRWL